MVKNFIYLLFFLFSTLTYSQYVDVDHTYSAQDLIENVLINNSCIQNITVTNAVSGNFAGTDKSFGLFTNNNSNFPFADGIVLSTGKLSNVPGPNTSLSDDNAPSWGNDQDLETALNISNTTNATIIEFDFTPVSDIIQFRYIFASEEYQENDESTCTYSDAFAFLIKPVGGNYTNIAVVPGTNTPVKVTTVHPEIPGECAAQNEQYFGSFNGNNAPINFNGQTKPLIASSYVTPNTTYHIKLVIADHINHRYDSAVFLEGGSFNISADLGVDLVDGNALCENEVYTLSPQGNFGSLTSLNFSWYAVDDQGNEQLLAQGPQEYTYDVTIEGTYKLVLDINGNCSVEDTIVIEYEDFTSLPVVNQLNACDPNDTFNLDDAESIMTLNIPKFQVEGYYQSQQDAENLQNKITNTQNYSFDPNSPTLYVRIENDRGCFTINQLQLSINNQNVGPLYFTKCTGETQIDFDLQEMVPEVENELNQTNLAINFYANLQDAYTEQNTIPEDQSFNVSELPITIFAKANNGQSCVSIIEIILNTYTAPEISDDNTYFLCEGETSIVISAGITENLEGYEFLWQNNSTTPTITVSEAGLYEVEIIKTITQNGTTSTCSFINTIEVIQIEPPVIDIETFGDLGNQSIQVNVLGSSNYTYAIQQPANFTPQNTFPLPGGKHTVYINDESGCGLYAQTVYIVDYMPFFTPNNDGINDRWKLQGVQLENLTVEKISIFNRYGKLLTILSPTKSWDGTYNNKNAPSGEYWFQIDFIEGDSFNGHFSLIR
ncbi:T9SS type B sorting domain-containing protein [Mesonia sp. K7]|uniref:T9SS type B sorting domain-containing protein n=1 Tax=Mesonia sp. K7 TaxID=2218606 RepID=UPI000DA917DB|nr:choice-of-anchor L domain-containing protein [Mesonia sp. K7]PZD78254.1 hypothetical protein DNG35_06025 [Mesonia sp. K7]